MDLSRASVLASLTLIVSVSLLSGPLVGLDLTAPASSPGDDLGEGAITVDAASLPANATVERESFGAETFALSAPPATIEVGAVRGQPLAVYRLEVPELGLTHATTYFLSPGDTGRLTLEMEPYSLSPDRVSADAYRGTLTVGVRIGADLRVLERTNVSVEVIR